MRYLPPVVTAPMIVCIGLSLAPVAIANSAVNFYEGVTREEAETALEKINIDKE